LEISSTSKGLLIPRMTTAQRNAIDEPVEGLMVYVMGGVGVAGSFMYFDGDSWRELFRADLTIPEIISAGEGKDNLYENSGEQQVVYTILVNTDITGRITYFLKEMGETDTPLLRLDDINKNNVILIADPDYEFQEFYDFKVRAVSAAGKSSEWENVRLSILPINEPAEFSLDPLVFLFTANENQTSIGRVTAIDPDAGATLRYSISGTETGYELEIEELTGIITFKVEPDYENVLGIKSYKAIVTVTDGHVPNDTTQEITVTLANVNEPAEFSLDPLVFLFTANENQTSIGRVTAIDPDAGATLRYSISGTETGYELEIEELTGIITFKVEPDYENVLGIKSYKAIVTVTDGHVPNDTTQEITVTLGDVDEILPVITIKGPNPMSINKDLVYFEHGANATDNKPGIEDIYIDDSAVVESTAGTYLVYYVVKDAKGNEGTATRTVVVEPLPNEVIGFTGRIWMDKNLGATEVANNTSDLASFGYLYQWGREADGHESRENSDITLGAKTFDEKGNNFIYPPNSVRGNWLDYDNFSDDGYYWNKIVNGLPSKGEFDPCPDEYRVPSYAEMHHELEEMNKSNSKHLSNGIFNSRLKLPKAGMRIKDGRFGDQNSSGFYWLGTKDGVYGRMLQINSDNQYVEDAKETSLGFSVRCIKQLPDENQEHED